MRTMTDPRLFQQVANLVDRLRDLPPGDASNDLREMASPLNGSRMRRTGRGLSRRARCPLGGSQ